MKRALALLLLLSFWQIAAARQPNIILIFTDDQGYHDLGCFGSTRIKTPNIDRMASEGLKLTSFYAQPVCGVSRAALMTGSYPIRVGEPGNIKRLHTVPHPKEVTMAETLREAGYATALIGKWHLTERKANAPGGYDPATMPNAQGFDHFYGTPLYNGFTVFVEDTKFRSPIFRNDQIEVEAVESWDNITRDYTAEALEWIEKNGKRPFFLYLAHNLPHIPVGASERFKGKSQYGPYGDTIEEIDWSCGEIVRKLKELGIDDDTLIVFTSDNGPWVETTRAMLPDAAKFIPRDHSGDAAPLRGWKMSAWDGGSRVPCVIRWPGRIPGGRVSDQLLSTMDLLPTFAALAGASLPEADLDGRDASDFLLGRTARSPREDYFYYTGCLLTGVRSGDWKLVLPRQANPPGTGWWGRMIESVEQPMLFDLKNDPGETRNLAKSKPDIHRALMERIQAARKELGDIDRTGAGARLFEEGPRRLQVAANRKNAKARPAPVKPEYDGVKPVGNLRFTFESGQLDGWAVTAGKAGKPISDLPALPQWKHKPFNKQGKHHLSTINTGEGVSDKQTVTLESPRFRLKGARASFLVSGGGQKDALYVALCDAKNGKELLEAMGPRGPQMKRVNWNVNEFIGRTVYLKIVDRYTGGWGHLTFDDFSTEGEILELARPTSTPPAEAGSAAFGRQVSPAGIRHSFLITGARTVIVDENNRIVWEARERSRDGFVLPNGNVLVSHHREAREYSRDGKVVWSYRLGAENKELGTSARLDSGNTLIVERGVKPRLLEVTPEGAIAVEVPLKPDTANAHMQTRMARKLPNGNYIVPHLLAFAVKEYTSSGDVVRTIRTDLDELGGRKAENWPFTAILLENDRLLVNLTHGNKTVEFDREGRVVWRADNSHVGGRFADPCGGQRLPNGNTIICSYGQRKPDRPKIFEITADKKVVWEYFNPQLRGAHEIHVLTTNGKSVGKPLK